MIILGLDPGTATTGYGVIEIRGSRIENSKPLKLVSYGIISTKANGYMPDRLLLIYNGIIKLIDKFKPDLIALESLFFFKNQKTVMTVSQARGVIMMATAAKKVEMTEFAPLRVKSLICQNGRAEKKEVQEKVRKLLKLKMIPKPDDAADALAVAICCTCNQPLKSAKIKMKRSQIAKIKTKSRDRRLRSHRTRKSQTA